MDSTLGKVLAGIVSLLALASVVVYGYTGFSRAKENSAVSDVATLATKIRGDYANNPNGYASLTNQVAIAAGDVPADMLQGSSIVNAWGSAVTIGPIAGTPKDFAIDLGAAPQAACVQLLTTDGNLMGAALGATSKQVSLPVTPAAAAAACAGAATSAGVLMTVQYGQSKVAVLPPCTISTQSFTLPGTYAVSVPTGCTAVDYVVSGAAGGPGPSASGGAGAQVSGIVLESPATSLTVQVGAGGANGVLANYSAGYGGKFSALEDPQGYVAIAGGGGGGGGYGGGGYGGAGGAAGQVGSNGSGGCDPRTGGYGATQSAPGQATLGYPQTIVCGGNAAGAAGIGMTGAPPTGGALGNGGGGGGGSGFFGGGAGSSGGSYGGGGGGGGGSSYASMASTGVSFATGGGASGTNPSRPGAGADGSVTLTFKP